MALPRSQDQYDRKWAEKAQELEFSSLDRVKAAAEKWATSLAALTGVFGIITLIKGPEDISKLTSPCQVAVGVALLLAVVCAFSSILLAALAAQGIPKRNWYSGPVVRKKSGLAADRAAKYLFWSRVLVAPVVIALAVAIGTTWFGDRPPDSKSRSAVLAVQRSGAVLCGQLMADERGNVALKVKDQSLTILKEVESIAMIEKCP